MVTAFLASCFTNPIYTQSLSTTTLSTDSLDIESNPDYGFSFPVKSDLIGQEIDDYSPTPGNKYFISYFGPRYVKTPTSSITYYDFHRGIDIDWRISYEGTDYDRSNKYSVISACDGTIDLVVEGDEADLELTGPGRKVRVKCDSVFRENPEWGNIYLNYNHLSAIGSKAVTALSAERNTVSIARGDTIGIVGESGLTSNIHLHFSAQRYEEGTATTNLKNINVLRFFPPEQPFHQPLSSASFTMLNATEDSAIFRIEIPYNQMSLLQMEVKNEEYHKVFNYEAISDSLDADNHHKISGLETFAYSLGNISDRYDATKANMPAAYPASPSREDVNLEYYPLEGDYYAYVMDIKLSSLPENYDAGKFKILLTDVYGNLVAGFFNPQTPRNFRSTAVTKDQIELVWTDSTYLEDGFILERDTTPDFTSPLDIQIPAGQSHYTDSGLERNTTYYYRIASFHEFEGSDFTEIISVSTLDYIAAPSNLEAFDIQKDEIYIGWEDNDLNETGFVLERDTSQLFNNPLEHIVDKNITHYTDTGLTRNTSYYYRVYAFNDSVQSEYSEDLLIITPNYIAAPSALAHTNIEKDEVSLSWVDNDSNELGFQLERSESTSFDSPSIVQLDQNTMSYTDTTVNRNTPYYYRLSAFNDSTTSDYSDTLSLITPDFIEAPNAVEAMAENKNLITINWTDNDSNESGFEIERSLSSQFDSVIVYTTDASSTTLEDSTVVRNTTYYYRIRAFNDSTNSSYSETISATTPDFIAAPDNLEIEDLQKDQVFISWGDNDTNEDGFLLERDNSRSFENPEQFHLDESESCYTDLNLQRHTTYYYRVAAINTRVQSEFSPIIEVTTPDYIAAPTQVSSGNTQKDRSTISWIRGDSNETGFIIQRAGSSVFEEAVEMEVGALQSSFTDSLLDRNSNYYYRVAGINANTQSDFSDTIAVTTPDFIAAPSGLDTASVTEREITLVWSDNDSNELGFILERDDSNLFPSPVQISITSDETNYTDTGLERNSTYYYRIVAYNDSVQSDFSSILKVTTLDFINSPGQFRAIQILKDRVVLSWQDEDSNESGFILERSNEASFPNIQRFSLEKNEKSYTDNDVERNTAYFYRLYAYNALVQSAYSDILFVQTPDFIASPSDLKSSDIEGTEVVLSWKDNDSNEEGFAIERDTSTSFSSFSTFAAEANDTSFTDTTLDSDLIYYYRVKAYNGNTESGYSDTIAVLPPLVTSLEQASNFQDQKRPYVLSPNPSQGTIRLRPVGPITTLPLRSVSIIAATGQLLWHEKYYYLENETITLKEKLKPGNYLVRITLAGGESYILKAIVVR